MNQLDATAGRPAALQRGDGAADVAFARRGVVTALSGLYQRDPCRVLFPRGEPGEPEEAVLLTTSGGLAGGDRHRYALAVGAGAAVRFATQAAEKVYRSLGSDSVVDAAIDVGSDAWCEWLPQETILFDGARLRRRTEVAVAAGGRLLAVEMLVFGRIARGERFRSGLLHDSWRIRSGGRLVFADALRLDGDIAAALDAPFGFAGAEALASVFYLGAEAPALLGTARALAEAGGGLRAGASLVNGMLLVRLFGGAPALRQRVAALLATLRAQARGLPPNLPKVWYC